MSRVVHFEIQAHDPDRALRFYHELLGWEFTHWGGPMDYWLIRTGPEGAPGIDGGLLRRNGGPPVEGASTNCYVCVVDVRSVDEIASRVPQCGGQVVVPKMAVPGIGWLAYAKDTEGNIFGFMQNDPTAA